MESFSQQYVVILERTRHDCVEIKVPIHVSRDETIMRLEELANLDFWKGFITIVEGDKHAFCFLILVILDVHCSIIGCCGSALLLKPEIDIV